MQKGSTLVTHWYIRRTTITAVHNNYSGTQHSQWCTYMHDTETFRLPECQVASTMISVLILSSRHFRGGGKGTLC